MLELTPDLILLVGAARSGTTLVRLILDAHPEIGCPPEAGLPSLIRTVAGVWRTLDGEANTSVGEVPLHAEAREEIRRTATAAMAHYCRREGKRLYCDKSLDSVHHLDVVDAVFPATRSVLIFRHVLDTVASGLDSSRWGFQGYGYLPFVQTSPDNFVAALVNYWLAHVTAALRWEASHPKVCHRVRYEDLVRAPEQTMVGIFNFLGVTQDLSVLQRALCGPNSTLGPGDHKVVYTSAVHTASVGRGKSVPVEMIPVPLLEMTNEKLVSLGYEPLDRSWNAEPVRTPGAAATNGSFWSQRLADVMTGYEAAGVAQRSAARFAIVTQDCEALRWVIDPIEGEVHRGDGEVEAVITGTAEDLALLLTGEANPGSLIQLGRIRHLTAREDVGGRNLLQVMRDVLDIMGIRMRPSNATVTP